MSEASPAREAEGLARALRHGQPGALERWFQAEHPHVWKLCFGFLADRTEADDAGQDAMLQLSDHMHDWDEDRPYAAWRNTIVLNICRDRLRRSASRRQAEKVAAEEHLPTLLPSPDQEASRVEVRDALRTALRSLSDREREVFVLRDLQGVSTSLAANVLGVGESSVRSLLSLARRRLRRLLGERIPGLVPDAEGGPA